MSFEVLINDFLSKYKTSYKDVDFLKSCDDFKNEMAAGLSSSDSSLPMIPTYIDYNPTIHADEKVIIIDAGGTNLRVGCVFFDFNKELHIEYFEKYPMPGSIEPINDDTFFTLLADYLMPVIDYSGKIGFCFSYPAEILPNKDGKAMGFSKEVVIDGLKGKLIGQGLKDKLKEKGITKELSIVILNDTVSTLLGGIAINSNKRNESGIGFILGTGTNTCYVEKNSNILKSEDLKNDSGVSIINMESGSFDKAPFSELDRKFFDTTNDNTIGLFEKTISGAYQGGSFQVVILKAIEDGILNINYDDFKNHTLKPKETNQFIDNPHKSLLAEKFITNEDDRIKLYLLLDSLMRRSAKFVAINLAGVILKTGYGKNPTNPVCIAAEGTTFYKSKLFRYHLDYYIHKYLNQKLCLYCEIVMSENLNTYGIAMAGLM